MKPKRMPRHHSRSPKRNLNRHERRSFEGRALSTEAPRRGRYASRRLDHCAVEGQCRRRDLLRVPDLGEHRAARDPAEGLAGERYLWLLADPIVLCWFLLFPGQVLAYARRNKILICWALLACLSAIWSLKAELSLYYGLQLFFTILMGFLLSNLQTRTQLIKLLFLALLPTQLLSFYIELAAPYLEPGFPGGGAFTHKNVLGSFMLLQIITSLCLFAQGWRPMLTAIGFLMAAGCW